MSIYEIKRSILQDSLYGVDIDGGAIEIAKLRLWLSLVVDEEDLEKIQTLPNLACRIMQGNSLIETFLGVSIDIKAKAGQANLWEDSEFDKSVKKLHSLQDEFFNISDSSKKQDLKEKLESQVLKVFESQLKQRLGSLSPQIREDLNNLTELSKKRIFFPWRLYFSDVFFKGGFDIMIANPPYIQLQKSTKNPDDKNEKFADLYKDCGFKTFNRAGDIYCLFYELGLNMLKKGGHLVYITSNKWMRAGYGTNLRDFLSSFSIKNLLDFSGFKVFKSATVDTNVIIVEKEGQKR